MEIPRKIDKEKFKEFVAMMCSKRKPSAKLIMQTLKLSDDEYELYFKHYFYKKGLKKKKLPVKIVKENIRQNKPNGYTNFIDIILNVR